MTKFNKISLLIFGCVVSLLFAGELQTRHRTVAYLMPDVAGNLSLDLFCVRIGKYTDALRYSLTGPDGELVIPPSELPFSQKAQLRQEGVAAGIYTLECDSGANATLFRTFGGSFAIPATSEQPLQIIDDQPKLYFRLARGAQELAGAVRGDAPAEHVALVLRDAQGQVVFSGDTTGSDQNRLEFRVAIPESEYGNIWSAEISEVKDRGFEDVQLQFDQGAEPTVALAPQELTHPPYFMSCVRQGDGSWRLEGRFAAVKNGFQRCAIYKAGLRSGEESALVVPDERSGSEDQPADWFVSSLVLEDDDFYFGRFVVEELESADGAVIARQQFPFAVCQGKFFAEIPWWEDGDPAPVTEEEAARGFQLFQRAEPGDVRPTAFPHPEEITDRIVAEASPGMITTEFFAFYPLRDLDGGKLTLGPLVGGRRRIFWRHRIAPEQVELRQARMWPQRTDWNASTYAVIPELLETFETVELKEKTPALFSIEVTIPPETKPGVYTAPLLLNGQPIATYQIIVDSFMLPEIDPEQMTFGLYADGKRWTAQHYTDEEILREMRAFRALGMNALMLYPLAGGRISYDGEHFAVDLANFRHQMQLYSQVGFPGVAVISLQDADAFLRQALGNDVSRDTPEYKEGFLALLDNIKEMAEIDGWPHYCIHTIDEPYVGNGAAEEAVRTLSWVKEAGFKTFNTCSADFVRSHIAQYLDYRCYNNIAFMTSPTQGENAKVRNETLVAEAQFWWYGSGCYTNGGLQQDGNLYSNRYMLGLFNYRTKATGAWTWTFLRTNDNPYNDFDGNDRREAKEACICYPAPSGHEFIPTLQWVALREGIYDYRYLEFWRKVFKAVQYVPITAPKAYRSQRRIQLLLDGTAWTCLNHLVTNAQLRELRRAIIEETLKLQDVYDANLKDIGKQGKKTAPPKKNDEQRKND